MKSFALSLLLAGVVHATEWLQVDGSWFRYPLPGAEVKSLVADPSTAGAFYAGTAQGGVYRSVDGGKSWTSPPGGSPFPGYSVSSLAVDPVKKATLWAGLSGIVKGGLLARSDDRGASWQVIRKWDDRVAARVVALSVQGGRKVLAIGGDYGVELSVDDGETWRTSAPNLDPGSGISFIAFHPARENTLFCGSFRHPFLSTDLARTWKRIAVGMIEDTEVFQLDLSAHNPDDFWAATCGWVYRSLDGGASWTRYKDGMSDRRTHVVRRDPADGMRVLAGTTGGLFETRDAGKSFRRVGPGMVVNTITFDPAQPKVLLVGTESDGVLRSEDGGTTFTESNRGLAEARISSVAETESGKVYLSRAADGPSGGLWALEPLKGDVERLPLSPPATVVSLATWGERLLAATPDGVYTSPKTGRPGAAAWILSLPSAARAFATDGARLLVATGAGVFMSRDGGDSWSRFGSLTKRVDGLRRARFTGLGIVTFAADSGGRTLWWDGRDWVFDAVRVDDGRKLSGGFGKASLSPRWVPEPIGLDLETSRSHLLFRPEDEKAAGVALPHPETGLSVSGWAGDPRRPEGLYLATIGRGLFRFVPAERPEVGSQ